MGEGSAATARWAARCAAVVLVILTATAHGSAAAPTQELLPEDSGPVREPAEGASHRPCGEWGSYGRVPARTFDSDCPSAISPATVHLLAPAWVAKTERTVTASPAVAGGRVFVGDWSATMYAFDAITGRELWRFAAQRAPGAPFGPIVSSAAVARDQGRDLVVFGSGPTMHAVDATTGDEVWSTYIGSARTAAEHPADEQTELESSPVVVDGIVYIGLDVHNRTTEANYGVRGGVLAFDLTDGDLLGRFDPEHDFRDASTGRRLSGCSSVWSSPVVDEVTGTLYFATGNCPHELPPRTGWGRHIEAVTAIDADPRTWADPASAVRWTHTPSPLNRDDTDFGATPNLFVDAGGRRVLGVGKKDAVYYALDPLSGARLWATQVAAPGNVGEDFALGGFIGSTATGRGGVFGGTAIGGTPYLHGLDGATGAVRWTGGAGPTYAASAHVNGVVLSGALDDLFKAFDARTGDLLASWPLLGPISSGPAVVGDWVYVGSGTSSSDLCAKDLPASDLCLAAFDEALGRTGGVHALRLAAPGHRAASTGVPSSSVLLANEGNRLWAIDPSTMERRVLVRSADDAAGGTAGREPFLDVNGQVCADPTTPRHIVVGEDTGQPARSPGWVRLRVDGASLSTLEVRPTGRLTPTYVGPPDGFGCGFLRDGRLLTTAIGHRLPGEPATGELILWFPPLDRPSVPFCKIDVAIPTPGGISVDGQDRVLVASNRGEGLGVTGSVLLYEGRWPTSPEGCPRRDQTGAPLVDPGLVARRTFSTVEGGGATPSALAEPPAGDGTYVSSVATGSIAEVDPAGRFRRFILPPSPVPGLTTGTPFGLAVDDDGTVYYADLGVLGAAPVDGNGTIRRIRFDAAGAALPPETLLAGIDFPDGLGMLRLGPEGSAGSPPGQLDTPEPRPAVHPGAARLPATGGEPRVGMGLALLVFAIALHMMTRGAGQVPAPSGSRGFET